MGFDLRIVERGNSLRVVEDAEEYQLAADGMAALAAAMEACGVVQSAEIPSFPPWPTERMSAQRASELWQSLWTSQPLTTPATDDEMRCLERFLRGWRKATASGSAPGTVPSFKFISNDGWYVTRRECRAIYRGLMAALARDPKLLGNAIHRYGFQSTETGMGRLIKPFSRFNWLACKHGGYRVW